MVGKRIMKKFWKITIKEEKNGGGTKKKLISNIVLSVEGEA